MGLNKALAFSCMSLMLACAGAAKADTFSNRQFVTEDEGNWGTGGVAASLLAADFNSVFAPSNDVLVAGVVGTPGQFFMAFSGAGAVQVYLPAAGNPGPLTASLSNPRSSPSGIFGGDVVALTVNVDFSTAGFLGTPGMPFGDLVLANLPSFDGSLNGLTGSQFLALANSCLGGGSCGTAGLDNVAGITDDLNGAFDDGTVSTFADEFQHARAGAVELAASGTGTGWRRIPSAAEVRWTVV
jgi:hypothetical protein